MIATDATTSYTPSSCTPEGPACDPELAKVVAAWPALAEPIRRAVLALVGVL